MNMCNILSKSHKIGDITYQEQTDITHSTTQMNDLQYQNQDEQIYIEHLDLINFKNQPCKIMQQHNHKHCPYYHNKKDYKRPGTFYSTDMCEHIERNQECPYQEQCQKSHNRVEQLYQPDKYKTKFCTYYPNCLEKCDYGQYCSFAHSENDIVIELIHNLKYDDDFYMFYFKTVMCPFNLTPHDKALCVYAHNWQDYRRKPNVYIYDAVPCPNWKAKNFIINYEDGCPQQFNCNKCHGWKEFEYHSNNYKIKPCQQQQGCHKGNDCPNYHSQKDRRQISSNVNKSIFRYVPKNRIVQNTFKVRSNDKAIYNILANGQQRKGSQILEGSQNLEDIQENKNDNLKIDKLTKGKWLKNEGEEEDIQSEHNSSAILEDIKNNTQNLQNKQNQGSQILLNQNSKMQNSQILNNDNLSLNNCQSNSQCSLSQNNFSLFPPPGFDQNEEKPNSQSQAIMPEFAPFIGEYQDIRKKSSSSSEIPNSKNENNEKDQENQSFQQFNNNNSTSNIFQPYQSNSINGVQIEFPSILNKSYNNIENNNQNSQQIMSQPQVVNHKNINMMFKEILEEDNNEQQVDKPKKKCSSFNQEDKDIKNNVLSMIDDNDE